MDNLAWINKKKQILSDVFVNKKPINEINFNKTVQENQTQNENKDNVILHTWKDLLHYSAGNNSTIEMTNSLQSNGFQVLNDDLGQRVFDRAIEKVTKNFIIQTDYEYEEEDIKMAIIDFISSNNLHIKGLHAIIKKLKILQPEDLPDLLT